MNNKLMTRIAISIFVFLSASGTLFAQNIKTDIPGIKSGKKALQESYIYIEQGDVNFIYNSNCELLIYQSFFDRIIEAGGLDSYVRLDNEKAIDSLVYKLVAPHFQNYKGKYSDKIELFEIQLYSKPNGLISEMAFVISRDANVPIKKLEELEKQILDLNLKLELIGDGDGKALIENSLWIYWPVSYSVDRMKKHF